MNVLLIIFEAGDSKQRSVIVSSVSFIRPASGKVLGPQKAKLVVGHARVGECNTEPSERPSESVDGVQYPEGITIQ